MTTVSVHAHQQHFGASHLRGTTSASLVQDLWGFSEKVMMVRVCTEHLEASEAPRDARLWDIREQIQTKLQPQL